MPARSVLNAPADTGLTRGTLPAVLGLLLWLAAGTVIVKLYDRKGFYRPDPNVNPAVLDYTSQGLLPTRSVSQTTRAATDAALSEQPQQADHQPGQSPQDASHQSRRRNVARVQKGQSP